MNTKPIKMKEELYDCPVNPGSWMFTHKVLAKQRRIQNIRTDFFFYNMASFPGLVLDHEYGVLT